MGLEPSTAGWKALTNPQSYGATPTTLIFVLIDGSTSLRVIFKHGRSSASLLFIFRLLQQYNFQNVINVKNNPSSMQCWGSNLIISIHP